MKGTIGMIKTNRRIVQESHRVAVQFLVAELNVALTFLDVARTTEFEETRIRNEQNARTAYFTVIRLLPRVDPTDEELPGLKSILAHLKDRLHALGYVVDLDPEDPSLT